MIVVFPDHTHLLFLIQFLYLFETPQVLFSWHEHMHRGSSSDLLHAPLSANLAIIFQMFSSCFKDVRVTWGYPQIKTLQRQNIMSGDAQLSQSIIPTVSNTSINLLVVLLDSLFLFDKIIWGLSNGNIVESHDIISK